MMKFIGLLICLLLSINTSLASSICEKQNMPEFKKDDLLAVRDWAAGGAFYMYAEAAGYSFDRDAYIKDCPNWALFGYARATGMTCLKVDVMSSYISFLWAFNNLTMLSNNPEIVLEKSVQEFYDEYAVKLGFAVYLTKLPVTN